MRRQWRHWFRDKYWSNAKRFTFWDLISLVNVLSRKSERWVSVRRSGQKLHLIVCYTQFSRKANTKVSDNSRPNVGPIPSQLDIKWAAVSLREATRLWRRHSTGQDMQWVCMACHAVSRVCHVCERSTDRWLACVTFRVRLQRFRSWGVRELWCRAWVTAPLTLLIAYNRLSLTKSGTFSEISAK